MYLCARTHGEDNPLSKNVTGQETLASMQDFLSQLHMCVWNGEKLIYEASSDKSAQLTEPVLSGKFRQNEGAGLTVTLEVPKELDNRYANRIGEGDWIFLAEEFEDEEVKSGKVESAVAEQPQTGDNARIVRYMIMVALRLIIIVLILRRRIRKNYLKFK